MRKMTVPGAFLAVLALAAACGDASDAPPATTPAATQAADAAAAVEQINRLCDSVREVIEAQGDFPLPDFDPAHPTPADLPTVGAYFAPTIAATESALRALRALDVPATVAPRARAFEDAVAAEVANARAQMEAARRRDVTVFVATLATSDSTNAAVDATARTLGAVRCVSE